MVASVKLGEVCEISIGRTPPRGNPKFWDSEKTTNNVWLSIADLSNVDADSFVWDSSEYLTDLGASRFQSVPEGTLLMSFKLTIGKLAFAGIPLRTNEAIAALVPKDAEKLLPRYLYYCLLAKDWDAIAGTDVKVKGKTLNKTKIAEIQVPITNSSIQRALVSKLDALITEVEGLSEKIRAQEALIEDLAYARLRHSIAKATDDSSEAMLGEICTITSSKRIFKSEYVSDGVPFYRTKEIKELAAGKPIKLELFISRDRYQEIRDKFGVPQIGDVLLSAVGTIGEVMEIKDSKEFYFKDGNIVWLKNLRGVRSDYLALFLASNVKQFNEKAQGSAYSALTIEKLNIFTIPLPTLELQKEIVEQHRFALDEIAILRERIHEKKSKAMELTRSLVQSSIREVAE
jgi:type I restriction enzyme S subunit